MPVTTFGVGPRIDEQIARHASARTGGMAMHESLRVGADAIGGELADAVRGTVFWPKAADAANWPAGVDVYPKTLPPLRSDRDTVLVGTDEGRGAQAGGNRFRPAGRSSRGPCPR